MNNNLKRFLSSVLAFVMLLSCMMVVNVSSVAAADGDIKLDVSQEVTFTLNKDTNSIGTSAATGDYNGLYYSTSKADSGSWYITTGYLRFTPNEDCTLTLTTANNNFNFKGGTYDLTNQGKVTDKSYDLKADTEYIITAYNTEKQVGVKTLKFTPNVGETSTEATTETTTETTTATTTEESSTETTTAESSGGDTPAGNSYVHNFTTDSKTSSFYDITGNLATGKGTVTYNGLSLTQCLKMESATSVKFTASDAGTLTLVFGGTTSAVGKAVYVDGTKYTADSNNIVTLDVAKGAHEITKGDSINLFYIDFTENGTSATTYTVSVNVTDGTNAVSGATVKLGDTTLAKSSTAGTYTATAITAGTVFTGLTVTATGYTDYTDTTERTINADTTIPVTLTATPTADPITVTVYDSSSREKIKGVVYYWTTTDGGSTTNEYKLVNSNAVIHVTEIANGTEAYLPTYSSGTNATNTPQSDMKDVLASATPKLYVTSEGYMGAEVTLPTSGNVNVLLTPLAEVNIATAGVYKVTANDIIAALLTSDANYAYQNPYINTAKVNGFTLSADANDTNQIFKIMQKVNTRNEYADKNNTARNLIQATDGCKIVYTPTVAGTLNISAASTSNNATGRGYTLDNVDNGTVSLTSTTAVLKDFNLTANTTYTMTVAGGINISSIEFVPSEVTKYSLTFTDDANGGGTAIVKVGDTTLTSGTEYSFDENSEVKISVTPGTGKKATVKVNGTIVALAEDNTYSFALSGDNTSIEVTYADETAAEEVNTLTPIAIGETVDFSKGNLSAKNTSLTSDSKAEYYADAVSGGGKTSVIKLKANDSTNYIKFVPAEDGNIAINFNSNPITVTGSDGSVVTLERATDGASNDVTRTMKVTAGVTYTITATSSGNAYVNSISLLASTVVAGNNIASIYETEDLTNNTAVLSAYGVTGTPEKAVRIIGQLKDITENNAADVDGAGVVILDCTIAEWKKSGLAESHIKGTLSVNKVYADVYNSADFDSSKVIDDTYTGNVKGLSELNSYFDLLVYADTATDFDGKAACAFTLVGDTKEYYNSNAELSGIDF